MRCRRACRGEEWRVAAHDYAFLSLRIIHMNESRHTCEWVTAHVWMRRLSHMCTWRHVTHTNESCHTYGWVTAHIWMSHGTYMNEAPESYARMTTCHAYEWVMSHIWLSHGTYMNESRHIYEWGSRVVCAHDDTFLSLRIMTHILSLRTMTKPVKQTLYSATIPIVLQYPRCHNTLFTFLQYPRKGFVNYVPATFLQYPRNDSSHFSTIPTSDLSTMFQRATIPLMRSDTSLFYNTHENATIPTKRDVSLHMSAWRHIPVAFAATGMMTHVLSLRTVAYRHDTFVFLKW